jgi:hypothetical protein
MILLRNSLIDQALKTLKLMRARDRFGEEPEEDTLDCGFLIAEALLLWIGIAGCFRTRASCDRQIKNAQDRPARNTCPRLPAASAAWADRAGASEAGCRRTAASSSASGGTSAASASRALPGVACASCRVRGFIRKRCEAHNNPQRDRMGFSRAPRGLAPECRFTSASAK